MGRSVVKSKPSFFSLLYILKRFAFKKLCALWVSWTVQVLVAARELKTLRGVVSPRVQYIDRMVCGTVSDSF